MRRAARLLGALLWTLLAVAPAVAAAPPPPYTVEPLFDLASFSGPNDSSGARLVYDRHHDEVYILDGGLARVFDRNGMEIHRFGGDAALGSVNGLVVLDDGGLLVLTYRRGHAFLTRCNFRGEYVEEFKLLGLPASLSSLQPDEIFRVGDTLYLSEGGSMTVVATDLSGAFRRSHALGEMAKLKKESMGGGITSGISVDDKGNFLFTIPTMFAGFVVSPDGQVRRFGSKGSVPGKFNISGRMAGDEAGNFFVLDRLRSVVMVWNKDLSFLGEFGYRGEDTDNLNAPFDIAVGNGKIFVSQARRLGVRVFKLAFR